MNRKKKMNQVLNKRLKRANAKLHTSNKPKYIAKADREKLELEAVNDAATTELAIESDTDTND